MAPWARLEPPATLTDGEVAIWRAVVASKPSEWFSADSSPVLEAYCQVVENYRRTAKALAETPPTDLSAYKLLTELATKQTGMIVKLATSMRLTQQSRYTPQAAGTANKKAAVAKKPWE